jgi:hypothetical protein
MQNRNLLWIRLGIVIGFLVFILGIGLLLVSLGQQGQGPLAFLATPTPTPTYTPTSEFSVITIHNHNCPTQDLWVDGKFQFNISYSSTKSFTILKGKHTFSACYIGTFNCGNLVEANIIEDTVEWTLTCIR